MSSQPARLVESDGLDASRRPLVVAGRLLDVPELKS